MQSHVDWFMSFSQKVINRKIKMKKIKIKRHCKITSLITTIQKQLYRLNNLKCII